MTKSAPDFCMLLSSVITRHNILASSGSILFACNATPVPCRGMQRSYLVGIAKLAATFLHAVQLGHYST